jgi:hypothetical protein
MASEAVDNLMKSLSSLASIEAEYDYQWHGKHYFIARCWINEVKGKDRYKNIKEDFEGTDAEKAQQEFWDMQKKVDESIVVIAMSRCTNEYKNSSWNKKLKGYGDQHTSQVEDIISRFEAVPSDVKFFTEAILRIRYMHNHTYKIEDGKLHVIPEEGLNYPESTATLVNDYFEEK